MNHALARGLALAWTLLVLLGTSGALLAVAA